MKQLIKQWRLLLFPLFLLITPSWAQTQSWFESGASYPGALYQVTSSSEPIEVQTREGYRYLHTEGDRPDIASGTLRRVMHRTEPLDGDGHVHMFYTESSAPYHVVSEERIQSQVFLKVEGPVKRPFQYQVKRRGVTVLRGEISEKASSLPYPLDLPYGDYQLLISVDGKNTLSSQDFSLWESNENLVLDITLPEREAKVRVVADPEDVTQGLYASLRPLDFSGSTVKLMINGQAGVVKEGRYELSVPSLKGYQRPGGQNGIVGTYFLKENSGEETINLRYIRSMGSLLVRYSSDDAFGDYLQSVRFLLTNKQGESKEFPEGDSTVNRTSKHACEFLVSSLPVDDYTVDFHVPKEFHSPRKRFITVSPNEHIRLDQFLKPSLGGVEARAVSPNGKYFEKNPVVTLFDSHGTFVLEGLEGRLHTTSLIPGEYSVRFEKLEGFSSPEPVSFIVKADDSASILGQYQTAKGELRVTYETDDVGTRLDMVQFWLSDSSGQRALFPHGKRSEVLEESFSREVVIKDLPIGKYTIEFIVPNQDQLFKLPRLQSVNITEGSVKSIHQTLVPEYAFLKAEISVPEKVSEALDVRLHDQQGSLVASVEEGTLIADRLLPGRYTIRYGGMRNLKSPDDQEIFLKAGDRVSEIRTAYQYSTGKLLVNWATDSVGERLDRIRFWLTNEEGERWMLPSSNEKVQKHRMLVEGESLPVRELLVEDLPVGRYTLEFILPNSDALFPEISVQELMIEEGETTNVQQLIPPLYGSVTVEVMGKNRPFEEMPEITLRDRDGEIIASSFEGRLEEKSLIPGRYSVHFSDLKGFIQPEPVTFQVECEEEIPLILGEYQFVGGNLYVVYETGPEKAYLEDVKFKLRTSKGMVKSFPEEGEAIEDTITGGYKVLIKELVPGEYTLTWKIPAPSGFFEFIPSQQLIIETDETTYVRQEIEPRYGFLNLQPILEEGPNSDEVPDMTLYRPDGSLMAEGSAETLAQQRLLPGTYRLVFGQIKDYETPEAMDVLIPVGGGEKIVAKDYKRTSGSLECVCHCPVPLDYLKGIEIAINDRMSGKAMICSVAPSFEEEKWYTRIDGLPTGEYRIMVSVPSDPEFFPTPSVQFFRVSEDEVTTVSTDLRPNFGGIEIVTKADKGLLPSGPKVVLKDDKGEVKAVSEEGHLMLNDLIPGCYTIEYGSVEKFDTPESRTVTILPGEIVCPSVTAYRSSRGVLKVAYRTDEEETYLDSIRFSLETPCGQTLFYPNENGVENSQSWRVVTIEDLDEGEYKLAFLPSEYSELFKLPEVAVINVQRGEETFVSEEIGLDWGSVSIEAVLVDRSYGIPSFEMVDLSGDVLGRSEKGTLKLERLIPGKYELRFDSVTAHVTPPNQTVVVERGRQESVEVCYFPENGSVEMTLEMDEHPEFLNHVCITLTDENGESHDFEPIIDTLSEQEGALLVKITDVPAGRYQLDLSFSEEGPEFASVSSRELVVPPGAVCRKSEALRVLTGGIAVTALLEEPRPVDYQMPSIHLLNQKGECVASGDQGELSVDHFLSGSYQIAFDAVTGYEMPEPIEVMIVDGQVSGPYRTEYKRERGDVVVRYSTGDKAPRLDRVRFCMIDSNGKRTMYPQEENRIDEASCTVEIAGLPTGSYQVQFLVPNSDGFFNEPELETLVVTSSEVTLIDKLFEPNFASLSAEICLPPSLEVDEETALMVLYDEIGNLVSSSTKEALTNKELPPGRYRLVYQDLPHCIIPGESWVNLAPGEVAELPSVTYTLEPGMAIITYTTDQKGTALDRIQLALTGADFTAIYPEGDHWIEDQENLGRKIVISDLEPGTYSVEFLVPENGLLQKPEVLQFNVNSGEIAHLEEHLQPHYSTLQVMTDTSALGGFSPFVAVTKEGKEVALETTESLVLDDLEPGEYEVAFQNVDGYVTPDPIKVNLEKPGSKEAVGACYKIPKGSALITYQTDEKRVRLEEIRFKLIDQKGEEKLFPENGQMIDQEDGMRVVSIESLPVGNYRVEFLLPNHDALFDNPEPCELIVEQGEKTTLDRTFKPHFGKMDFFASAMMSKNSVEVALWNEKGKKIQSTKDGQIAAKKLPPGSYRLVFADFPDHMTPDPMDILVERDAHVIVDPVVYQPQLGSLEVLYSTGEDALLLDALGVTVIDCMGNQQSFSSEDTTDVSGEIPMKRLIVEGIPVGTCQVMMDLPDVTRLEDLPAEYVTVKKGEVTVLERTVCPKYSQVTASIELPEELKLETFPKMVLSDLEGNVICSSEEGELQFDKLLPGRYQISFGGHYRLITPDPIMIESDSSGPFVGRYELATGTLLVSYDTGMNNPFLEDIRVTVSSEEGVSMTLPSDDQPLQMENNGVVSFKIDNMPIGYYTLSFSMPHSGTLFESVKPSTILIENDRETLVKNHFEPRFSRLTAEAKAGDLVTPIAVYDCNGELVYESAGFVDESMLIPGEYEVRYLSVEGYDAPDSVQVMIAPGECASLPMVEYQMRCGELTLEYSSDEKNHYIDLITFDIFDHEGTVIASFRDGIWLPTERGRKLKIDRIPEGSYTLEFDTTETSGALASVAPLPFEMTTEGKALEQEFTIQYATLQVELQMPKEQTELPSIKVENPQGVVVAESKEGTLIAKLLPGEYDISFEEVVGFKQPNTISVEVEPGKETVLASQEYQVATGFILVDYDIEGEAARLENMSVIFADKDNNCLTLGGEAILDDPQRRRVKAELPVGSYEVSFDFPNEDGLFEIPSKRTIEVMTGEESHFSENFQPRYGRVEATIAFIRSNFKEETLPTLSLQNEHNQVIAESTNGQLIVDRLLPGNYNINFGECDGFNEPDSYHFNLKAGETVGSILGEYQVATGSLSVSYTTGECKERLDRVRFWLSDQEGFRKMYPNSETPVESFEMSRTVSIDELPVGSYQIEWVLPNKDNLFASLDPEMVMIGDGETIECNQKIEPRYASVKAVYRLDVARENGSPMMTLEDQFGQICARSDGQELMVDRLLPGSYVVRFEALTGYQTPDLIAFSVEPNDKIGPLTADYHMEKGSLSLNKKMVDGEEVTLFIESEQGDQMTQVISVAKGRLSWTSDAMPTGTYRVDYKVPSYFKVPMSEVVTITKDQTLELNPEFISERCLEVMSNVDQAVYLLENEKTGETWKGSGRFTTFSELLPGNYKLSFSSSEERAFILPKPRQVMIKEDHNPMVQVEYSKAAYLVVSANIENYGITVYRLDSDGNETKEKWSAQVNKKSNTLLVAEGNYRVVYHPLNSKEKPEPFDVEVTADCPEKVHGVYEAEKTTPMVTREVFTELDLLEYWSSESLLAGEDQCSEFSENDSTAAVSEG